MASIMEDNVSHSWRRAQRKNQPFSVRAVPLSQVGNPGRLIRRVHSEEVGLVGAAAWSAAAADAAPFICAAIVGWVRLIA